MSAKITDERIRKELKEYNCEFISQHRVGEVLYYVAKCFCGEIYEKSYKVSKRSKHMECKKCAKIQTARIFRSFLTYDALKYFIEYNSVCKFISSSGLKNGDNVNLTCEECGCEFSTLIASFKSGKKSCNKCSLKKCNQEKVTKLDDVLKILESQKIKYVSGVIENEDSLLELYCEKCEESFQKRVFGVKRNKIICQRCSLKHRKDKTRTSTEKEQKKCDKAKKDKYKILEVYFNGEQQKIKVLRVACGHEYTIYKSSFYKNRHICKICDVFGMEKITLDFLEKQNIDYVKDYFFSDLIGVGGGTLFYDYAVIKNNKIYMLIECQGEQHYKPVNHYGGEDTFIRQQEHDNRKRNYAKEHNIPLLEIPYWESENIENILSEALINV